MDEQVKPAELSAGTFEVHVLKTHPEPFAAVRARKKWLEIRRHDRDFKEGDTLWLEEYDPAADHKSGQVEVRLVTHVLPGGQYGIEPGFCAISMADVPGPAASPSPEGTRERGELVEREEALKWFLKMIVSAEGFVSSYDGGGDATNVFCGDFEPTDTWNWAEERGLTTTSFDSMSETSKARITNAGRAHLAALTLPPVPGGLKRS